MREMCKVKCIHLIPDPKFYQLGYIDPDGVFDKWDNRTSLPIQFEGNEPIIPQFRRIEFAEIWANRFTSTRVLWVLDSNFPTLVRAWRNARRLCRGLQAAGAGNREVLKYPLWASCRGWVLVNSNFITWSPFQSAIFGECICINGRIRGVASH